ncbi:MAG: hypothetical protein K2I80_00670 [Ruminococcus sp.]|nr:hypothetical protein [Ruminococcus sp.]MDE6848703.1 hypothetical protein [Ruminococcus sp.]
MKNIQDIMKASEGAKSQLNVLMEQFEGQLRNERNKLRMLENVHHQQMVYEKKNAKKLFKKEYIPPLALAILEIMIVFIIAMILLGIAISFDLSASFVLIGMFVLGVIPFFIAMPRIKKRNQKAREDLARRLAYDENAPDFDYGSQNNEVVQLREMAMKEYDKQHFSIGKIIGLYIVYWYFSKLMIIYVVEIIDYLPIASDFVVAFFHLIFPVIALVFIIRRNMKLKKQLNEKLDIINKKNKI